MTSKDKFKMSEDLDASSEKNLHFRHRKAFFQSKKKGYRNGVLLNLAVRFGKSIVFQMASLVVVVSSLISSIVNQTQQSPLSRNVGSEIVSNSFEWSCASAKKRLDQQETRLTHTFSRMSGGSKNLAAAHRLSMLFRFPSLAFVSK